MKYRVTLETDDVRAVLNMEDVTVACPVEDALNVLEDQPSFLGPSVTFVLHDGSELMIAKLRDDIIQVTAELVDDEG